MSTPVCVVVGIGPGNGAALSRRFAREGYAVAMLSRSTTLSSALAAEIRDAGGEARAYACDVTDERAIVDAFARVQEELGPVATLVYNAGSGSWGTIEETTPEAFETAWKINAKGVLIAAQQVIPGMKERGGGNILLISATAARRGGARFTAFAAAKAAQRSLAQSMARQLWPSRIHVAVIIIDGMVDTPRVRAMMDKPDEFYVKPEGLADTTFALTKQDPSAWSFEVEARPFGEKW